MATMTPYNPRALPKISTISIFMNEPLCCASRRAAPDPIMPTAIPVARFVMPTRSPAEKVT